MRSWGTAMGVGSASWTGASTCGTSRTIAASPGPAEEMTETLRKRLAKGVEAAGSLRPDADPPHQAGRRAHIGPFVARRRDLRRQLRRARDGAGAGRHRRARAGPGPL